MTKDEALKQALEALELHGNQYPHMVKGYCLDAITAIKQALEAQQEAPVALESGKRLIVVDQSFDDLMYWLDRCEHKGHLENCADLVEPYSAFQYENYTAPPAAPEKGQP
jgi:hypothetical protein